MRKFSRKSFFIVKQIQNEEKTHKATSGPYQQEQRTSQPERIQPKYRILKMKIIMLPFTHFIHAVNAQPKMQCSRAAPVNKASNTILN